MADPNFSNLPEDIGSGNVYTDYSVSFLYMSTIALCPKDLAIAFVWILTRKLNN